MNDVVELGNFEHDHGTVLDGALLPLLVEAETTVFAKLLKVSMRQFTLMGDRIGRMVLFPHHHPDLHLPLAHPHL